MVVQRSPSHLVPPPGRFGKCAGSKLHYVTSLIILLFQQMRGWCPGLSRACLWAVTPALL